MVQGTGGWTWNVAQRTLLGGEQRLSPMLLFRFLPSRSLLDIVSFSPVSCQPQALAWNVLLARCVPCMWLVSCLYPTSREGWIPIGPSTWITHVCCFCPCYPEPRALFHSVLDPMQVKSVLWAVALALHTGGTPMEWRKAGGVAGSLRDRPCSKRSTRWRRTRTHRRRSDGEARRAGSTATCTRWRCQARGTKTNEAERKGTCDGRDAKERQPGPILSPWTDSKSARAHASNERRT